MTRLIVLANGETEWDIQGWLASDTDVALSERGLAQAERAAWSLRRIPLDLVLSAPTTRARTTAARVVSGRVAPRVEVDARLRELGFGPFEGFAPREPASAELLAAYAAWCDESAFAPAGCEPFTSAARRARSLVADVSRTPGTVLLVTHHVFARILIVAAVLGLPAHAYGRIRLDRGALAEIRLDPGPTAPAGRRQLARAGRPGGGRRCPPPHHRPRARGSPRGWRRVGAGGGQLTRGRRARPSRRREQARRPRLPGRTRGFRPQAGRRDRSARCPAPRAARDLRSSGPPAGRPSRRDRSRRLPQMRLRRVRRGWACAHHAGGAWPRCAARVPAPPVRARKPVLTEPGTASPSQAPWSQTRALRRPRLSGDAGGRTAGVRS